jgi:hypothetical protein
VIKNNNEEKLGEIFSRAQRTNHDPKKIYPVFLDFSI